MHKKKRKYQDAITASKECKPACLSGYSLFQRRYATPTELLRDDRQMKAHQLCSKMLDLFSYFKFRPRTAMDVWARGSEFKFGRGQCYDEAGCPNCMHAACNSTCYVRTGAVHTEGKKKKWDLEHSLCLHCPWSPCVTDDVVCFGAVESLCIVFFPPRCLEIIWLSCLDSRFFGVPAFHLALLICTCQWPLHSAPTIITCLLFHLLMALLGMNLSICLINRKEIIGFINTFHRVAATWQCSQVSQQLYFSSAVHVWSLIDSSASSAVTIWKHI